MNHATEVALLRDAFTAKAQLSLIDHLGKKALVLKETGKGAKLKNLTLSHLDDTAFALAPEAGQGPARAYSPLLAKTATWTHHQACDAVLFVERNGTPFTIYIELKSDLPKGCEEQFNSTQDFLGYVWSVLKRQKQHQSVTRKTYRVVFNTKHTRHGNGAKQGTHAKYTPEADITYIKVADGQILSPEAYCPIVR
jgi:hypothetical protein